MSHADVCLHIYLSLHLQLYRAVSAYSCARCDLRLGSSLQDKAQLIVASSAKDLAGRLGAAVAAVAGLSDAELAEEHASEAEGEEAHVLRLALGRALSLLQACPAPSEQASSMLKALHKLLAVGPFSRHQSVFTWPHDA